MPIATSIERYMTSLPSAYRPSKANGEEGIIQIDFTDHPPESWHVDIAGGHCEVHRGTAQRPTIHVEVERQVFMQIQEGKLMANMALSRGKMRVTGDLNLAFRIGNAFKLRSGLKFSLI